MNIPNRSFNFWVLAMSLLAFAASGAAAQSLPENNRVSFSTESSYFKLAGDGQAVPLLVNSNDYWGVIRAAGDLQRDINRVTGIVPQVQRDQSAYRQLVIIGTLGKSKLIDRLADAGKIDVSDLKGKREASVRKVVDQPLPGVDRALVIAGSDKRGTIYGIYELSSDIGVSPWYYFADVPVASHKAIYVNPERYKMGEPAVKYRGIFINDEAPALTGWVYKTFGGFNHRFYEHVFELILRLKGNYMWPAMWGKTFNQEDVTNPMLADEYGIVMGTSHHEPMMRAQQEWKLFGSGAWNYQTNDSTLRAFWRQGIRNMDDHESIVTVGMRGDGDKPMSEESNIDLLERIVRDQRQILHQVTGKNPAEIPQVWALYKEVQEYYDKGMRVPDDVTLLFSDDNWGNIRRLPDRNAAERKGGYGIYYHLDYVGGPRSYKWLNTSQISRIWEQMHLAYQYEARRIWIVNVGDLKPMEYPISFFLDYAWNPKQWPASKLPAYSRQWAARQFGGEHAEAIADILEQYTRFNSRRKPELLSPETYSLAHYREADRVVKDYRELAERARRIYKELPDNYKAAYYQLVLFPVEACANLNALYVTVAKNRLYARQGRAGANVLADSARALFDRDAQLTRYYNKKMAGGKWDHMMDQTHIGYTYWNQPEKNTMPEVKRVELPDRAELGVSLEGTTGWWPKAGGSAVLPAVDVYNRQKRFITLFNRGSKPFDYTIQSNTGWLQVSNLKGTVDRQKKITLNVDWSRVPAGEHTAALTVEGAGRRVQVMLPVSKTALPGGFKGFVEGNGVISIEAADYGRAVNGKGIRWQKIPGLGRTGSAVTAEPVTAGAIKPGGDSPHLEYRFYSFAAGDVKVQAYLSPTLNFHNTEGLKYGVSIDDGPIRIVNMHADESHPAWQQWVSNNINIKESVHSLDRPGEHVLKFWMVDPGVDLQKLVIDAGGLQPSYLGPPESYKAVPTARTK